MKRFVSVWLPNWPLTRLSRARPGRVPEHEPFALVDNSGRGIVLAAVNDAAAREGIAVGMALADARAAMPALRVLPGDPAEDARALLMLSQWAGRYGPGRAHEASGMDGLWCDVTGVAHLYGGEEGLLDDLMARLAANKIPARAAIADTYGASYALARYGAAHTQGYVRVPQGQTKPALAHLPVEALRLDADVVLLLKRLGLKRIADLYAIERVSLAHRFSSKAAAESVLLRLDQALGLCSEPLKPLLDVSLVFARRAFPEPLISSSPLEAIIEVLCEEIAATLKARDEGALMLRLCYFRADGTSGFIVSRMSRATNEAGHFNMLIRPKLDTIDAGFGIDLVSLEALETAPCKGEQHGFSDGVGKPQDAGALIDMLSNRLGNDAVVVARPQASHMPGRSEVYTQAIDTPSIVKPYAPPWPYGDGSRRPAFLLARPEPISVIAEVPDGPPARFTWRRVERRVARAQGPERIAPEWWGTIGTSAGSKRPRTRDYYQIEDEQGGAYWVFRHGLFASDDEEGRPPSWFLHGLFC